MSSALIDSLKTYRESTKVEVPKTELRVSDYSGAKYISFVIEKLVEDHIQVKMGSGESLKFYPTNTSTFYRQLRKWASKKDIVTPDQLVGVECMAVLSAGSFLKWEWTFSK